MSAYVLSHPKVEIDPDYAGTPAPVDVSCHIRSVAINADVDEVDVSSFCNPGGTAAGPPAYTLDVDWIINDDSPTVLAAFVGETVELILTPNAGATEVLRLLFAFGPVNPAVLGTWTAGEIIEASTSHSVLDGGPGWGPAS